MPRIAVITPYHREPLQMLAQCHESVLAQQAGADHFMVADGFPRPELASWNVRHVVLPTSHADCGATPRGIGALLADSQGYDFVAFLDADNWYLKEHLASLLELHRSCGAPVCTSFRSFHDVDGTKIDVTEAEEDGLQHVDTSCFLLHRAAFGVLPIWSRMPKQLALLCDRVFVAALRKERLSIASTHRRTIAYRTLHELHYTAAGLTPPPGYKPRGILDPGMQWLMTREGVDESFRRLGFWPVTFL